MLYKFNQALHVAGKDFPRGVHEVLEKQELHPHFLRYVGLGLIVDAPKQATMPAIKADSSRNEALYNKLVKKVDAKKASLAKPEAPAISPEAPSEVEGEKPVEDAKEKPKGKSGKKT